MRPRRVSDEEILEVARQTFLELGPHTSTTVIAERVGVCQATLFKRFGSKDALLVQSLRPASWKILNRLIAGPDDRPMRQQLTELLSEMVVFFELVTPCLAALRASGLDTAVSGREGPSSPVLARLELTGWLVEAQRRVELSSGADPDHLSVALIAICQARALRRHLVDDSDLKDDDQTYLLAVLDMLFEGVSP